MLLSIFYPLLIGLLLMLFIPSTYNLLIRQVVLFFSSVSFYLSLLLLIFFNKSSFLFQFIFFFNWFSFLNFYVIVGIDGLNLFFIILTTFLIPLCILISWKTPIFRIKEFLALLIMLEVCLLFLFLVLDLFLFYIFFESVLIPITLIVGIWGSRTRRIKASYFLFFYTLFGSLLLLLGILFILFEIGTTNFFTLCCLKFSYERQLILWLCFFMAFAVKIPIIPFHLWLCEAHVESPTIGSVILAGLLLKLGLYGLLRFSFVLFPYANTYFIPLLYTFAVISIIHSSMAALRQVDIKKMIAYSSIAHMNFTILGLNSYTIQGIEGGIFLMLSHGLVSSALFTSIGFLYDRYHTRLIPYYSGLVVVMPLFSTFLFIFILANIGLPGTSSFVGELLIVIGSFISAPIPTILGTINLILGTVYSIWLYNRITFGNLNTQLKTYCTDLSFREFIILGVFLILIILLGFFPNAILDYLYVQSCVVYLQNS